MATAEDLGHYLQEVASHLLLAGLTKSQRDLVPQFARYAAVLLRFSVSSPPFELCWLHTL